LGSPVIVEENREAAFNLYIEIGAGHKDFFFGNRRRATKTLEKSILHAINYL